MLQEKARGNLMKLHCMSDLHFEHMDRARGDEFFNKLGILNEAHPVDLLILAGDICQVGRHEAFFIQRLTDLCKYYKQVLMIPGNHEYYSTSFYEVDKFFQNIDIPNLLILQDETIDYAGQHFMAGTMWFRDTNEDKWTKRMLSDFSVIKQFEPEVYLRHENFNQKILGKLKSGSIVITHHTPLEESIHPRYRGSIINQWFCNDVSQYLNEGNMPKLWCHGHTHEPFDYMYKGMRVYCNPLGYPNEGSNPTFWGRVLLEVE